MQDPLHVFKMFINHKIISVERQISVMVPCDYSTLFFRAGHKEITVLDSYLTSRITHGQQVFWGIGEILMRKKNPCCFSVAPDLQY